jgi:para-nitrobenzyl esterase
VKPVALLLLPLLLAAPVRAEDVVQLDSGPISGTVTDGLRTYKGVPFAKPPVGPLRWRAPERPEPWEGVRACVAFGPSCPQPRIPVFGATGETSEDCLYLNVWTTARDADAKLPVMVWIHGGSYAFGSGSQPIYDGAALARRGVVLVTINYRLGPFGFFAHPALSAESGRGSGAYGFLDQIAALEWVQRNIAAFGGDPGCVTIFGESAGSGSVTALLVSPLTDGLFHRAIAQSGVAFAKPLREAEQAGEGFAKELGCEGEGALAALRAKSAKELLDAASITMNIFGEGAFRFGPTIDGHVLPRDPVELMPAQRDVPLLLGTTADEGTIFVIQSPEGATKASFERAVTSVFGAQAGRVLERYPVERDADARGALARVIADAFFVEPTRAFARARAGLRSRTFMYHFTRVSPGARMLRLGAHHASELGYVFGTLQPLGTDAKDGALAATIASTWVRFARTGDPNGDGLPEWPAYTTEGDQHLELGDEVRVGAALRREQCDALDSVWAALRQPQREWH